MRSSEGGRAQLIGFMMQWFSLVGIVVVICALAFGLIQRRAKKRKDDDIDIYPLW
jgi:hypothetical protein